MKKPTEPRRVYWDSAAFIAYLQDEDGRVDKCVDVLDAAEREEILICTSALTLAEVVRGRNLPLIPASGAQQVSDLFAMPFLEVFGLDRVLAEQARSLCWKYGTRLHGNDAIHVATANEARVTEFHSFNGKLNKLLEIQDDLTFEVCEPRVQNRVLPFGRPKGPEVRRVDQPPMGEE